MATTPNKAALKRRASIPAGVKQPDDHQSAKEDVTGPRDTVVSWPPLGEDESVLSHEYVIVGQDLDDAELLEYFTDDNFVGALRIILGPKGWASYKENARNAEGKVTASGAAEFLNHILREMKRGNS